MRQTRAAHIPSRPFSVLRQRLRAYAELIRLDRPIGIWLLLWPTLWALWMASAGHPRPSILAIFVAGVVLMRSAGCAINDYADRGFDPHVERTRQRPLARGAITPAEALGVFAALSLVAFLLVLQLNALTVKLALVGVVLAASYPFMKRFHHLPQIHLGAAFGWAVPMAFAAESGAPPPPEGWLLFLATVLWATVYDTFYAMADREDDLRIGVKSTAILFGRYDRLVVGMLQLALLVTLGAAGLLAGLRWPYAVALGVAALLMGYHQWLVRRREPQRCFRAFLHNNWIGLAVFLGIAASYALP